MENELEAKVARNAQIEHAHKLANKFAESKMTEKFMFEVACALNKDEVKWEKEKLLTLKKVIGREMALAYGKGYMDALTKPKLFTASGREI